MTNIADSRHGCLSEFLALTEGLSISKIAEVLRCCERSVRNWIKERSPIPWHRIELLRVWRANVDSSRNPTQPPALPADSPLADVLTDEQEKVAWVAVIAPQFLTRRRSFLDYVKFWDVAGKIKQAKAEGTFAEIVRRWRSTKIVRPSEWRSGPLFADVEPDFPPPPPGQPRR